MIIFVADLSGNYSAFFRTQIKQSKVMQIVKTSEKVLIWLHRTKKTQQWLAEQFGVTRQAVSQKINDNMFSVGDIIKLRSLGCDL